MRRGLDNEWTRGRFRNDEKEMRKYKDDKPVYKL